MNSSKFNVFLSDYNIIFNTLTGYAIKVSEEEMKRIMRGEISDDLKQIWEVCSS